MNINDPSLPRSQPQTPPRRDTSSIPIETIRTKDLIKTNNQLPIPITEALTDLSKDATDFQFVSGFNTTLNIGYINNPEFIFLFQNKDPAQKDAFSFQKIFSMSKFFLLNLEPVFFRTFNQTFILFFDERGVHVSSIFDGNGLYKAWEVIDGEGELQNVCCVSNTTKAVELVLLDSTGKSYKFDLRKDLNTKITPLDKPSQLTSMFSSLIGKTTTKNDLNNAIFGRKTAQKTFILKFFNNKVAEFRIGKKGNESSKRARDLSESIKSWEGEYIKRNKFILISIKAINYLPLSFNDQETTFTVVYCLYIMNMAKKQLVITKAATVKYNKMKLEKMAETVLNEREGHEFDPLYVQLKKVDVEIFFSQVFYSSDSRKIFSNLYRSDKFFESFADKQVEGRIYGCGVVENQDIRADEGFFAITEDKFEYFEEMGYREQLSLKYEIDKDLELNLGSQRKKVVSSKEKQGILIDSGISFNGYLRELFDLFLEKEFDVRFDEGVLRVSDLLAEKNLLNELKKFVYDILEEKNRNIIMVIRSIKEDLAVVEKRKKKFGQFDDIITLELRKKNKKLQKFEELLEIIDKERKYSQLVNEIMAVKEAIQVAMTIRANQREAGVIAGFFEEVLEEMKRKWKLDKNANTDIIYTNIMNIQTFFRTYNKLMVNQLNGDSSDEEKIEIINKGVKLYSDAVEVLNHFKQFINDKSQFYVSLLIRDDKNLLLFFAEFVKTVNSRSIRFDKKPLSETAEKILRYIHTLADYIHINNRSEIEKELYDFFLKNNDSQKAFDIAKE